MQKFDNIDLGVSETPLRKKFKEYMAEFDNKIGLYKEKENMIRNNFHRKLWLNKFFFLFHLTDIGLFGGAFLVLAFAEGTTAGWLYPSTIFIFALAIVSVIVNLLLVLGNRNKRKKIIIDLELEKLYAKEYYLDKAFSQCELASQMVIDLMIEYDHGKELEKYKETRSKEEYQNYYSKLETKYKKLLLDNKVPEEAHAVCAFYENWYKEKVGDVYKVSHDERLALAEFKNRQYIGENGYNERLYQQYVQLLTKYSSYENLNIVLYNDTVNKLKEIIDYKDVKKLIDLRSEEIKNNCEKKYKLAKEQAEKRKKQSHKKAIELLEQIIKYKDSKELIKTYKDEIDSLSNGYKKIMKIILSIFITLILIVSTILFVVPVIKYGLSVSYVDKAKELFESGEYEEAIEYYNKTYVTIDEDFYNTLIACNLLEKEKFEVACTYLREISEFVNIDVESKYEIKEPENLKNNVLYNYRLYCVYDNIVIDDLEFLSYNFEVINGEYIINIKINVTWKVAKNNHTYVEVIFIPADMTEIPSSYCEGLNKLKKVVFEENSQLQKIGEFSFYECRSLESIVIPDGVTNIGSYAFYGCNSLKDITLPKSLLTIGNKAFYNCSFLKNISIPNGTTIIGEFAFLGCVSLNAIMIPSSVEIIGYQAFYNCNDLRIYCEAKNKPEKWDHYWNDNCTVFWGYK